MFTWSDEGRKFLVSWILLSLLESFAALLNGLANTRLIMLLVPQGCNANHGRCRKGCSYYPPQISQKNLLFSNPTSIFDQEKCVTSVMKGMFDRWVFFSPLSKKTSPGLMLKAKKPYLLCQKCPSTLMADLLRVQRQVMAHMVPLKRCSVYKCQRAPVLYNDDNFQD
jgi:hypothetical protein